MKQFIYGGPLESLLSQEQVSFGSKAFNLAKLKGAGLPVPDGLVICNHQWDEADRARLDKFLSANPKRLYAVRSSAVGEDGADHSFAGQFDTFLEVPAGPSLDEAIHKCFAAKDKNNIGAYLRSQGANEVQLQVFVQEQIKPAFAGVYFHRDPRGRDGWLLEVVAGLGEQLVSGQETPHQCSQLGGEIQLPHWQKSFTEKIVEFGQKAVDILGYELDMEWAIDESGQVWLLQARPITSNGQQLIEAELEDFEKSYLPETVFDGATLSDLGHLPSPMTISLWHKVYEREGAYIKALHRLAWQDKAADENLLHTVLGRPYLNLSAMEKILLGPIPFRVEMSPKMKLRFQWSMVDLKTLMLTPKLWWNLLRMSIKLGSQGELLIKEVHQEFLPFEKWAKGLSVQGLEGEGLVRELQQSVKKFSEELLVGPFSLVILMENILASIEKILVKDLGEDRAESLKAQLMVQAGHESVTTEMMKAYHDAAEQESLQPRFLEEYGFRGPGEMDLKNPRYQDMKDPFQAGDRTGQKETWQEPDFSQLHWSRRPYLEKLWPSLKELVIERERQKMTILRVYNHIRRLILRIAEENGRDDDIFFLKLDELYGSHLDGDLIQARKRHRRLYDQFSMPTNFVVGRLRQEMEAANVPLQKGEDLKGMAIAPGQAQGTAVVVSSLDRIDWEQWPEDAIIVAQTTDPGWTPLFERARAVVVETGGVLSHAGILAREMGLPCVGQVEQCVRKIKTGDRIYVNGSDAYIRSL